MLHLFTTKIVFYIRIIIFVCVFFFMSGSWKFYQRMSNSDNVFFRFLFDEGKEDPKSTKAGHHRPASETPHGVSLAGRWWPNIECWLGSFFDFSAVQTSVAKKPYIFCDFSGGSDPLSPPLDRRMQIFSTIWAEQLFVYLTRNQTNQFPYVSIQGF